MSRNVRWLLPLLVAWTGPLAAQSESPPTATAEEAIEVAAAAYGPPPPEPRCRTPENPDEIVVCAQQEQDQEQFRVRSDADSENDYARETMNKGDPKAPDVAGPGIFRGPPTVGSLCIPGLQKCPPPPAVMIDFSELPEAPPGSDADRIARGLPPVGNDGDPVEPAPAAEPAPE